MVTSNKRKRSRPAAAALRPRSETLSPEVSGVIQGSLLPPAAAAAATTTTTAMAKDQAMAGTLADCEAEIRGILQRTLEDVVRLGEIFSYVKSNLIKESHWLEWLEVAFGGAVSHDTVSNWMNAWRTYESYKHLYPEALRTMPLGSLYKLSAGTITPEAREATLELVESGAVSPKDARSVLQTYRKIQLASAGVEPAVAKTLTKVALAEDPKHLRDFQRLSKPKQAEVAKILSTGAAATPREALRVIRRATEAERAEPKEGKAAAAAAPRWFRKLSEVPTGVADLALIEAPLGFDFVDGGSFGEMMALVGDVLAPGGFAMVTVGHKAAMWVGPQIRGELKPLHLVTLRRAPGQTRAIPGLNINSASVVLALCYKPPYRAPRTLVADLHTAAAAAPGPTEALEGLDVVPTGLEDGFRHLIASLGSGFDARPVLLHHTVRAGCCFPKISEFLKDSQEELKVREVIEVG